MSGGLGFAKNAGTTSSDALDTNWRKPTGKLVMVDPHREPANRHERRARDAWLRTNAPKKGMQPEEFLTWLRSLNPQQLQEALEEL